MEKLKNGESEVKKLIPAVGFIKTRKLESIAMDMAEKMHTEAREKGFLILEISVDRDGSRDIDREQLDEIYEIMSDLAKQGKAIIMISSEMSELLGMADRICVMCNGKLTGEIDQPEEMTQARVMGFATKF